MTTTEAWLANIMDGYTEQDLSVAFTAVKDQANWKLPINTKVGAAVTLITRGQIKAAIDFYCGGGATFTDHEDGSYTVTAPGYYETIGA